MLVAENFGVGAEADAGAAAVLDGADLDEFGGGDAFGEVLAVEDFVAGDLGGEGAGEGVDDRGADAVQAA